MLGEMLDTSPAARDFYYRRLTAMTPAERLALAFSLTRQVRTLAERSILQEHPGISAEELRARLAVRLYGRDMALRALGHVPDDAR